MARTSRHSSRATATTRAIARTGHRMHAALARVEKTSERAMSSLSRTVEQMGGDVSALPTSDLRRIVEQSFKSAEEVLQAQRSFALGLIDAMEAGTRSKAQSKKPRRVGPTPVARPVKHAVAS